MGVRRRARLVELSQTADEFEATDLPPGAWACAEDFDSGGYLEKQLGKKRGLRRKRTKLMQRVSKRKKKIQSRPSANRRRKRPKLGPLEEYGLRLRD